MMLGTQKNNTAPNRSSRSPDGRRRKSWIGPIRSGIAKIATKERKTTRSSSPSPQKYSIHDAISIAVKIAPGKTGTQRIAGNRGIPTAPIVSETNLHPLVHPHFNRHRSCRYISFHPDGKTIAISDFKAVHIYDIATAKEVFTINDGTGAVYTPDGKTLVYRNYPGEIKLWDVGTGKERAVLKIDVNETNVLACSNGTIAYRGYYPSPRGYLMPTVDLVDFAGKNQFRLIGHENGLLRALVFSPDGSLSLRHAPTRLCACGMWGTVKSWFQSLSAHMP